MAAILSLGFPFPFGQKPLLLAPFCIGFLLLNRSDFLPGNHFPVLEDRLAEIGVHKVNLLPGLQLSFDVGDFLRQIVRIVEIEEVFGLHNSDAIADQLVPNSNSFRVVPFRGPEVAADYREPEIGSQRNAGLSCDRSASI